MKLNEETILKYLDGLLNNEEEKAFNEAIAKDEELNRLFLHHKQIHESLAKEELQSPSIGFADRVMDAVYHLHANRTKFFNRSRLIVIGLIGLILITTAYYLSMKFYPTLGGAVASELTLKQFTFDLNPARNFLDSNSLFKIVFYVNGVVCLLLLDRAVLKPFFARRRERYSM
jgi:hypothetical protein